MLDNLYDVLKLQYFTCRMHRALNIYCSTEIILNKLPGHSKERKKNKPLPADENNREELLNLDQKEKGKMDYHDKNNEYFADSLIGGTRKRKTRRGSRAGSHVKSRRLSAEVLVELIHSYDLEGEDIHFSDDIYKQDSMTDSVENNVNDKQMDSNPTHNLETHTTAIRYRKIANSVKMPDMALPESKRGHKSSNKVTVGMRLWNRVLTSARIGAKYCKSKSLVPTPQPALYSKDAICEDTIEGSSFDVSMLSTQPLDDGDGVRSHFETADLSEGKNSSTINGVGSAVENNFAFRHCHLNERRFLTQLSTQTSTCMSGTLCLAIITLYVIGLYFLI